MNASDPASATLDFGEMSQLSGWILELAGPGQRYVNDMGDSAVAESIARIMLLLDRSCPKDNYSFDSGEVLHETRLQLPYNGCGSFPVEP